MGAQPVLISAWKDAEVRIKPGHATRPVLVMQAGANGARLHALSASISGSANTVRLFRGRRLTLQSAMGIGTLVDGGGSADTVTRTAGSFLDEKWSVDDLLVVRGATTLANNFSAVLTGAAAQTLTVATGTVAGENEVLPAGAELWRLTQLSLSTIAANAGNSAGTKALDLITADKEMIDDKPDRFMTLGPDTALFAAAGSTLSGGVYIDISAYYGDY